ncbi:hypothetical protein GCG54_00015420 [Colletotrichum gloeosporioides]|uniref:Zn(2)-C6 fungal-type domain-containing protein n=1 Tax=Colletotrichum gloeosporioides TaxID=474922 RepID=A0A8H4FF41_COLGL|nr:uncharacterized protein GCG54_00015420 [Colletotrichum gloeosporioides]KAF3800042.1 hypothetical protein GCG54_00015420 [Colletotrichum gloeosporioides]
MGPNSADSDGAIPAVDLPSCEGCRRRKLKCTRQRPLCSNCERLELEIDCIYENRRNKPGLKGGAVESLNRRLEAVENAVFSNSEIPTATTDGPVDSQTSSIVGVLSTLATEINKLNSTIGASLVSHLSSSESGPQPSVGGNTHNDQESFRPNKRPRYEEQRHAHIQSPVLGHEDPTLGFPCQLSELLDAYFTRVQPWIPLLQEAGFRKRLLTSDKTTASVILHAMLVAASRFIGKRDHAPSELKSQAQRSRNLVIATSMNAPNVESLQALAIVAFSDPLALRFMNPDRLAMESVKKPGLSLVRSPDQFNTCSSVMRMQTGKGVHHLSALRHILRGREIGSKRKSDAGYSGTYLSWTGQLTVRRVLKPSRTNSSPVK